MGIQVRLLRHVTQALLMANTVATNRLAGEQDLSIARLNEAGDHLERRRFPRAIGTQVAGDFSRPGDEADLEHYRNSGILLGHAAQFEHLAPFMASIAAVVPPIACS